MTSARFFGRQGSSGAVPTKAGLAWKKTKLSSKLVQIRDILVIRIDKKLAECHCIDAPGELLNICSVVL